MGVAIGLLEVKSLARSFRVADSCLKAAPVSLQLRTTCPGKALLIISGEISAVQSAVEHGHLEGSTAVINSLVLGNLHQDVLPALAGIAPIKDQEALGIIETFSVSGAILAADAATKASQVYLFDVRPAQGLGGKGLVLFTGSVGAVQVAVAAATRYLDEMGDLVDAVVIPSPHQDLWVQLG
ncbi:MAG: BMC domain-containing protein [Moorella sp. (in: Bacteria)]|nr:BMC domain-containing protein [Moorella sp. (in: firmicutes)]